MDDFVLSNLHESRNEWASRLISILTPLVIEGLRSIFNESLKLCVDNKETGKYLMTFQNLLSRIPKWNSVIVEEEKKRIIERSGCHYLEDLITCVHVIQLKVLTCIRVGNKQKKIDISIPKLDHFIHKTYINVARKIYMNVYLFEKNITPLQAQKNNRELENIVQECIVATIRESIPTEAIIRAYLDESVEQEEVVTIENIEQPVITTENTNAENTDKNENDEDKKEDPPLEPPLPEMIPSIKNLNNDEVVTKLSFNDFDTVLDETDNVSSVNAPKTIERLEEISSSKAVQRKLEEEEEETNNKIKIHTEDVDLETLDLDLHNKEKGGMEDIIIDYEEL